MNQTSLMDDCFYSTPAHTHTHTNHSSHPTIDSRSLPHSPTHPLSMSPRSPASTSHHSLSLNEASNSPQRDEYEPLSEAPSFLAHSHSHSHGHGHSSTDNDSHSHNDTQYQFQCPSLTVSPSPSPNSPALFRYQVAGHSPLLWHAGTVCKPFISQEHDFYCHVEAHLPCLLPFLPKFYGVLDTERMDDSVRRDLGFTSLELHHRSSAPSPSQSPSQSHSSLLSPFASTLHERSDACSNHQYIVIEDLTFAYTKPCIIDLKLGTRQHGLTDCAAKIASKVRKCQKTTSAVLGLRLCGMQAYHSAIDTFIHHDKYYGRALTVNGFFDSLREFFSDGHGLRYEVMSALLARLCLFKATLEQLPEYRFYSSSLLLVYEGEALTNSLHSSPSLSPLNEASPVHSVNVCDSPLSSSLSLTSLPSSLSLCTASSVSPVLSSLGTKNPALLSRALQSLSSLQSRCQSQSLQQSLLALNYAASSTPALTLLTNATNANARVSNDYTELMLPSAAAPRSSSSTFASSKQLFSSTNPPTQSSHAQSHSQPQQLSQSSVIRSTSDAPLFSKLYTKRRKTTQAKAKERARLRGNVDVRLIDFAHTARVEGPRSPSGDDDEGLLFGFEQLIATIAAMMDGGLGYAQVHTPTNHATPSPSASDDIVRNSI